MGRGLFKRTRKRPTPPGAEIIEKRGKTLARWTSGHGNRQEAPVTPDGQHVMLEAEFFTARYRAADGRLVQICTGARTQEGALSVLMEREQFEEKVRLGFISTAEASTKDWQTAPLAGQVDDYFAHLRARGVTPRHIKDRKKQLDYIFSGCGFVFPGDLERLPFERWLNARKTEGMSAARRNIYHSAVAAFAQWLVEEHRVLLNHFAGMPKANEKADKRRVRRALSAEEIPLLLKAAQERPLTQSVYAHGEKPLELPESEKQRLLWIGRKRALLYKTMLSTGLRLNEIRSISIGRAYLAGGKPYLELQAKDEKARRGAELPLPADLAAELASFLVDRLKKAQSEAKAMRHPVPVRLDPAAPLLRVPQNLSRILDKDLGFARIAKADDKNRTVDVHSLRHSFASHLNASGVAPRVAQALMRHSDIRLTMNTYQDLTTLDTRGALDRLPPMPLGGSQNAEAQAAQAGQNAPTALSPIWSPHNGKNVHFPAFAGSIVVKECSMPVEQEDNEKPQQTNVFSTISMLGHSKIEWRPQGDSNPCRRRERAVS